MKKGKCKHDSQSQGSAPSTSAHGSRETGGTSGRHVSQKKGWKERKYVASHTPGV